MPKTMFDKIWDAHEVADGPDLHRPAPGARGHLAQAFEGLRLEGRKVRRPDLTLATADHNVPTDGTPVARLIADEISREQIETLDATAPSSASRSTRWAPTPGHRARHRPGAGADAAGHDDRLRRQPHGHPRRVRSAGVRHRHLARSSTCWPRRRCCRAAQDDADRRTGELARRHRQGPDPGHRSAASASAADRPRVEYAGAAIRAPVDGRPDDGLQHVDRGRRPRRHDRAGRHDLRVPRGPARAPEEPTGTRAGLAGGRCRPTRARVRPTVDARRRRDLRRSSPGARSPRWSSTVTARFPTRRGSTPRPTGDGRARPGLHGLEPGTAMQDIPLDRVFIGSCTNSRIEDLRAAARVVEGRRVADTVRAMVVPGSQQVKAQAEEEGLDEVFRAAGLRVARRRLLDVPGHEPRHPGPGERCASTSNRNFEGRQGKGGRTHLVSPRMAAAAAIAGHFVDIRDWQSRTADATSYDVSSGKSSRRSTAPTSTPTRSSRSSS